MLTCATCGNEEQEGAAFCGNCGTAFAPPADARTVTCASCGNEEPERAGFCGNCGAAFATAEPQPPADAPTVVEPAPVGPQPPPPDPEPAATPSGPVGGPSRRPSRRVLLAGLAVLVAGGVAATLFGAGVVGGGSAKAESALAKLVNEHVLVPLGRADETAARNAGTQDAAFTRAADGTRIVRVSDDAFGYLRRLSDLSADQRQEVQLLLALVAANRGYGQAFAAFTPDAQGELVLEGAAAAVRAAIARAEGGVSADFRLPARAAIVTLRAPTVTTTEQETTATPAAPASDAVYVGQVDALLRQSHGVVVAVRSFVRRASGGAISRASAVNLARSLADQRRRELAQTQGLTVPQAFASAQRLLLRSFQASLADDEALIAWAVARRDGSGNARAAFERANRLGARATALKRQFLRVFGQQRRAATGLSPASLPDDF
jgi:Double zinc ribbon